MNTTIERAAIRNWWLITTLGVLITALGFAVLWFPAISFVGMTLLFGVAIFVAGVVELTVAIADRNAFSSRGWVIAASIVQIILGVVMMFDLGLTAITLPIFLGFWLVIRSFTLIGAGADMRDAGARGSGLWTIISGVLLLFFGFMILMQPLLYGAEAVVIWVGVSMIFAGVAAISYSLKLKNITAVKR